MNPLRCFQHCKKDTDLVCFRLPEQCPLCGKDTAETPCRIPPYVLPSPFVSSVAVPRSVVVKPTIGTFISHYDSSCDLHIGLTNDRGHVTEFDERGLTEGSQWSQCLVVLTCPAAQRSHNFQASTDQTPHGPDAWDVALGQLCSGAARSLWDSGRYNEQTWNCFDLVLRFLELIDHDAQLEMLGFSLDGAGKSGDDLRTYFCNRLVVHRWRRVDNFVQLYRRVMAEGCVCVARQGKTTAAGTS